MRATFDRVAKNTTQRTAAVKPVSETWTNVATADVDGIKTATATSTSIQTFAAADLDGAVGSAVMDPPRNVTITSDSHADHDAVDVVITGTDINGDAQTDTITKTDAGNTTDAGTKAFRTVETITIPAESGTGGSMTFGFGTVIGFAHKLLFANSDPQVLSENEAGTPKGIDALAGTYVAAATSGPNGTVDPSADPNATNDYYYAYLEDLS